MPKPKFKQRDINGNIYYSYDIEGKQRVPSSSIEVGTIQSNPSVRRQQQRITVEGSNKVLREKAAAQKAANTIVVGGRPYELDTPKQATIGPINRDLEVFNLSPEQLDAMVERDRLEKAQQEAATAAGNFVNMLTPSTIARAAYDATTGDKSFLGSMVEGNKGLGNGAANLVFDIVAPFAWAKGMKYVGQGLNKGIRFMNSPLTGNWTRLGSKEYRLSPGTLRMNGISIERRPIDMSKWTPEQWTDAQDAAIAKVLNITPEEAASLTEEQFKTAVARGIDISEAQRLRDLHFKFSAPNTKIKKLDGEPAHIYHGTDANWVKYDPTKFGSATDDGYYGVGLYGTEYKPSAKIYGDNVLDLYINAKRPYTAGTQDIFGNPYTLDKAADRASVVRYFNRDREGVVFNNVGNYANTNFPKLLKELDNADAVVYGTPNQRFNEVVIPRGEQMKLADAVTFDDNGIRIPLGKRDNFNINDIRFAASPFRVRPTKQFHIVGESEPNIQNFIDNDIIPRLRLQGHNPKSYKLKYEINPSLNPYQGQHIGITGQTMFDRSLKNNDFGLIIHETGGHGLRRSLDPKQKLLSREDFAAYLRGDRSDDLVDRLLSSHAGREIFNQKETELLSKGYPWVKKYYELHPEYKAPMIDEQGAINTQFRARLSEKGKFVGKELDKKIDTISDGELIDELLNQGYTQDGMYEFIHNLTGKSFEEIDKTSISELSELARKYPELKQATSNMREAMKKVGSVILPIGGAASLATAFANSRNKTNLK